MIHTGDCVEVMRGMPDASVDAVVTDPPYGLEFMGKTWDRLGDVGMVSHAGAGKGGVGGQYGSSMPSYNGSANRRCRKCGHWAYSGTPCRCEAPDFPSVVNAQSRLMQQWHEAWATEAFRVLKPGGYLLAFGGTRTVHRLASAIEDAGFEIRDELVWIYASGFPKSLDVGKAMDRAAGAEREVVVGGSDGVIRQPRAMAPGGAERMAVQTMSAPVTDLARQWNGWGTALKPAHEPIVMARKPLQGTVAGNVAKYGTGAINVDGTRIGTGETLGRTNNYSPSSYTVAPDERTTFDASDKAGGRWPSNVLLSDPELFDEPNPYVVGSGATTQNQQTRDYSGEGMFANKRGAEYFGDSGGYARFFKIPEYGGSDDALPRTNDSDRAASSEGSNRDGLSARRASIGAGVSADADTLPSGDSGSTDRRETPDRSARLDRGDYPTHFIVPKADRADREPTLRGQLPETDELRGSSVNQYHCSKCGRQMVNVPGAACQCDDPEIVRTVSQRKRSNVHPTVKPTELMRHLVRLVTPPGGTVLDPFLGSGTTGIACELEGFPWIGIEREPEYVAIAEARLNGTQRGLGLDVPAPTPRAMGTSGSERNHPTKYGRRSGENYSGGWAGTDAEEAS